jgi:hypothetical protein
MCTRELTPARIKAATHNEKHGGDGGSGIVDGDDGDDGDVGNG